MEPYSDHSDWVTHCSEDIGGCAAGFCSEDCAKLKTKDLSPILDWKIYQALPFEEQEQKKLTCSVCRLEHLDSDTLLKFALSLLGKSRKALENAYRTKFLSTKKKGAD